MNDQSDLGPHCFTICLQLVTKVSTFMPQTALVAVSFRCSFFLAGALTVKKLWSHQMLGGALMALGQIVHLVSTVCSEYLLANTDNTDHPAYTPNKKETSKILIIIKYLSMA